MYSQKRCPICEILRGTELHKEDCQWYLKTPMPLSEGGTKSQLKTQMPTIRPPSPPPTRPQQTIPHPNIVQTKNEEIIADIRNKMSPNYSFLQMAYEEKISESVRETMRLQALMNYEYIIERLKEIK